MKRARYKNIIFCITCIVFLMQNILPLPALSESSISESTNNSKSSENIEPGLRLRDEFASQVDSAIIQANQTTYLPYSVVSRGYEGLPYGKSVILPDEIIVFDGMSEAIVKKNEIDGIKEIEDEEAKEDTQAPDYVSEDFEGYGNKAIYWDEKLSWIEYSFAVPEDGLYEIETDYYLEDGGGEAIRSIMIDGAVPFEEAIGIAFQGGWVDAVQTPIYNSKGDQVSSSQNFIAKWRSAKICDAKGFSPQPLRFYFTKGEHRVRFLLVERNVVLGQVRLSPPEDLPSYESVKAAYEAMGYTPSEQHILFQAEENIIEKSDSTIRATVNSDVTAMPQSITAVRLNIIGDWRWRAANQYITWQFDVPEDGLYKIGVRYMQWWNDGLASYRHIMIDGIVPFEELLEYKFAYVRQLTTEVLHSEDGAPFLFYLTKGTHTLTMTIKLGELAPVVETLLNVNTVLSDLIMKITMITGSSPDVNYEYELEKRIPSLIPDMQALYDTIKSQQGQIDEIASKNSAVSNSLNLLCTQLEAMIQRPDTIPRRLDDMKTSLSTIGEWYMSLQYQPIIMDYVEVAGAEQELLNPSANVFNKIGGMIDNLAYSFVKDYDGVGDIYGDEPIEIKETITVWIGRGKEWAEVIKMLADSTFTQETGIAVKMNVLPSSQLSAGAVNALMLAISSGKDVDVAMGVAQSSPVEFAIRNAVTDLSQFDDYDEVIANMLPGILEPFKYNDGVYGLPETMNFSVLFYRKDICENLGISLPETWEDLYQYVIPTLTRNNLSFYYPTDGFPLLLLQNGGTYYKNDGLESALDSPEAYKAFREFCELFTHYGVPVTTNFYNRFRTGDIPMGIAGYNEYLQLQTAAPELIGKWGIAVLPGHKMADGSINRAYSGLAGEADIILAHSEKQDASWEFLKWWLSTETQLQFAREIEAIIGVAARWNTSNVNAFTQLSWNRDDLSVISGQWDMAFDMPNVLGGYFTTRHTSNAWNRVVISNENLRDSLEQAVEDINKELFAKQEEYTLIE